MRLLNLILALAIVGLIVYFQASRDKWKALVASSQENTERALATAEQLKKTVSVTNQSQRRDVMTVYRNAWFHGYKAGLYNSNMETTWPADSASFDQKFFIQ